MIIRTTGPRIIRGFMIIPNTDEGMHLMHSSQIRIQSIEGIANAIIIQSNGFLFRNMCSANFLGISISFCGIFIDIITKKQNGIEIISFGQMCIGIEISLLIICARCNRKSQGIHACIGSSFGSADERVFAFMTKAIIVISICFKSCCINLDCIIFFLGCGHSS